MTVVTGERDVLNRLDMVARGLEKAASAGLVSLATEILRLADRFVPRRTGELARSAFVSLVRSSRLEFGYGARHAPRVHEDADQPGRKWLQRAVMAFTGQSGLKHVADVVQQHGARGFRGAVRATTEFSRGAHGN